MRPIKFKEVTSTGNFNIYENGILKRNFVFLVLMEMIEKWMSKQKRRKINKKSYSLKMDHSYSLKMNHKS